MIPMAIAAMARSAIESRSAEVGKCNRVFEKVMITPFEVNSLSFTNE